MEAVISRFFQYNKNLGEIQGQKRAIWRSYLFKAHILRKTFLKANGRPLPTHCFFSHLQRPGPWSYGMEPAYLLLLRQLCMAHFCAAGEVQDERTRRGETSSTLKLSRVLPAMS